MQVPTFAIESNRESLEAVFGAGQRYLHDLPVLKTEGSSMFGPEPEIDVAFFLSEGSVEAGREYLVKELVVTELVRMETLNRRADIERHRAETNRAATKMLLDGKSFAEVNAYTTKRNQSYLAAFSAHTERLERTPYDIFYKTNIEAGSETEVESVWTHHPEVGHLEVVETQISVRGLAKKLSVIKLDGIIRACHYELLGQLHQDAIALVNLLPEQEFSEFFVPLLSVSSIEGGLDIDITRLRARLVSRISGRESEHEILYRFDILASLAASRAAEKEDSPLRQYDPLSESLFQEFQTALSR